MTEHYSIRRPADVLRPGAAGQGRHRLRFYRDIPSRFGIIPRFGTNADVRWFEAQPATCCISRTASSSATR
jgi:carotenoid cleavage dioxygenase